MFKMTVTDRESYLAFRAAWKKTYKNLSQEIRDLKRTRKQYTWKYRPRGDTGSPKKIKTGDNPIYEQYFRGWELYGLKDKATRMMTLLEEVKASRPGKQPKTEMVSHPSTAAQVVQQPTL